MYDAIIIGAGPNGLSAAVALAQAGRSVLVLEASSTIGGGARTQELTLPGFYHDVCSAVHPLGISSPFLRTLPLEQYGLEWIQPEVALAHPLDDGSALLLRRSVAETARELGIDARAYECLMNPFQRHWDEITRAFLGPFRKELFFHPFLSASFGLEALRSTRNLVEHTFQGERARVLFAGLSAHSILPFERMMSAAAGLMLALAGHTYGWPVPRGGAQAITNALAAYLHAMGGEIQTGVSVQNIDELPPARAILCDVTPRQLVSIAGHRLPEHYTKSLARYRYGPGVFKVDYALDGPAPWQAQECLRAGTVHLGGSYEEIARSERMIWAGGPSERPYVLVAQQSLLDPTRAPQGKQTFWAYCHVPHGSPVDMTERIEAQIERFAPGFRERVLARSVLSAQDMERYNPNYIGGDINSGVLDIGQLFTRPVWRLDPYTTPLKKLFVCSASTPPGGGVHGLCGYYAAQAALRTVLA
ncbi:MAG TPA: NAD(P)/FAD-dependent oxidoreductase [Dictyobacter sp.]|jgi:phytoene dehydrogenase-like protein|nr:NAD(P)/FAD-dependent oxidoreductase [Dictyobacter sp.]